MIDKKVNYERAKHLQQPIPSSKFDHICWNPVLLGFVYDRLFSGNEAQRKKHQVYSSDGTIEGG
jgi:hypothetical protein